MKRLALLSAIFLLLVTIAGCAAPIEKIDPPQEEVAAISRTAYRISAELSTEEKTLSVLTEIDCSCPSDGLSAFKFHIYPNAYKQGREVVTEDKLRAAYPKGIPSYGGAEILSVQCDLPVAGSDVGEDGLILTVRLSQTLKKGEPVRFKIAERVTLANIKHRLGYYDGYYYLSDFYPELCPFSEGRFLTYDYTPYGDPFRRETADFTLDLTLPIGTTCASSAGEIRRETQGSIALSSYEAEEARDIALVASSKLRSISKETNGKTLSYYYADGTDKDQMLSCMEEATAYFESLFGAYPYPTYSVVSAPFFEAGVEHSGLAVISQDLSFPYKKKTLLHETAHQWWYGKVGNDEYLSPWIDEGLAEYSVAAFYRAKGFNGSYREMIAEAEDAYSVRLSVKGAQGARFDLPLSELKDGYCDRVYAGGLLLFCSLAGRVGENRFHDALKDFAERYRGKVSRPDDLIESLSSSLGEDTAPLFRAWTTGSLPAE